MSRSNDAACVDESTTGNAIAASDDDTYTDKAMTPFRSVLPQIMASMSMNLLQFGVGLGIGFPTVLIPILTGLQSDRYPNEVVHFSEVQASWYGSILFLTEPLGSVCSGWINEQIGRKRAILLACVPFVCAWLLLYTAQSPEQIFAAGVLLGFGSGLTVPVNTFVGEISQPSVRGALLILCTMSTMVGVFTVFALGAWLQWRDITLVGFAMPLLAAVCVLCIVPETPQWLISNGRPDEAAVSLGWLRGWQKPAAVRAELDELVAFIAAANACEDCQQRWPAGDRAQCSHVSSYREKIRDLVRTKTVRPFVLLVFSFFTIHSSGNMAVRPFLVQIFATFGIPLDANVGLVAFGLLDIACNMFCVVAIPVVGKRPLFLGGLTVVALACWGIAANAFMTFPTSTSSFDPSQAIGVGENYVALVLFVFLAAGASVSGCVPWMLNSEIYPFRVRGTASGLTSACSYIGIFVATKTYLDVERGLSIGGGFIMYGVLTAVGLCVLYQVLPETEGRTLEEIEQYFSDKTRRLTDRTIRPIVDGQAADCGHATADDKERSVPQRSMDNPAFVENV